MQIVIGLDYMKLIDFFLLILITTIWGLNFAISKIGMEQLPPLFLSASRFSIVALAIFFIPRPKVNWRIIFGIALFIAVIKFSLLFIAIDIGLGAGLASLIVQGQVFFTIILTFALHQEALKIHHIFGLVIGFIGLAIMGFNDGGDFNLLGFFLVIVAAFSWAVANMFFRKIGHTSTVSVIVWASFVATPIIWLMSYLIEGPDLIYRTAISIDLQSIIVLLYIAILSTFFCYSVWGRMLSKYPAASVTPFALLIPVSGLLGGVLLVNETLSATSTIAILVIMVGLSMTIFGHLAIRQKQD